MWIVWLAIGVAIGWLIPQPVVTWPGTGERLGVLAWSWRWIRNKLGVN
jgi:hypothetical protein